MAECTCSQNLITCQYAVAKTRNRLSNIIRDHSLEDLDDGRRRFLPLGKPILELIDECIRHILGSFGQHNTELGDYIMTPVCKNSRCTGHRLLFVSLTLCSRENLIQSFRQSEFSKLCDCILPCWSKYSPADPSLSTLDSNENIRHTLENSIFWYYYWPLKPPFFDSSSLSAQIRPASDDDEAHPWFVIRDEISLPWISLEPKEEIFEDGQYSLVKRIKIHNFQHDLKIENNEFALKVFMEHRDNAFEEEARANSLTGTHPRTVPLLAAFRHRRRHYLIFPWARGGSLSHIWSAHGVGAGRSASWFSFNWFFRECWGIADAVVVTHKTGLLHFDIKPENILAFPAVREDSAYQLKLADFGLSRRLRQG